MFLVIKELCSNVKILLKIRLTNIFICCKILHPHAGSGENFCQQIVVTTAPAVDFIGDGNEGMFAFQKIMKSKYTEYSNAELILYFAMHFYDQTKKASKEEGKILAELARREIINTEEMKELYRKFSL